MKKSKYVVVACETDMKQEAAKAARFWLLFVVIMACFVGFVSLFF